MPLRPVDPNVSFPALEVLRIDEWEKGRIFERSVDERPASKTYTFYDGPPFATGLPHYGHLVASIIKDTVPRYWTMRGHRVERRWGWDCHGLPVENATEKDLGLKEKRDIEEHGVHAFNEACRGIVLKYTSEWKQTIRRLGRWIDFEGGYRTMDRDFMESVWWAFSELWKKDLIYQGFRIQPYCTRCGTPLSNFELNQPGGYQMRQDPSVTVRVALEGREDAELWLWTTTPWTLPSNTAVAVGADVDYVEVRRADGRNAILAEARVPQYFPELPGDDVVKRYKGSELAGLAYTPLFEFQPRVGGAQYTVLVGDFVTTEDGTGIVHMAPAFGEDDFQVGQAHELPVFRAVGPDGRFTDEVPDFAGIGVKDADKPILDALKAAGSLVERRTLDHNYPHCYRCDTPLIYMALETWFMRIEPVKQSMLAANRAIHWVPKTIGEGRFGNWLEGARDWNFSRNRYWGTPIPIWICDGCGECECIGSVAELEQRVGESVDDLHKHFVDGHTWSCASCHGTYRRIPEIFDCWFESGSMPFAQRHHPFENADTFEAGFPADFIAEGLDQTRGWFYTLTVLAAALYDRPAFQNCIVNGIVLAEDGEKMSKRKQNYPDPNEVLERYGSDALRLYLIDSPIVHAKDMRFSEAGVQEKVRAVLLPLWNSFSFLTRYACLDRYEPDGTAPDPKVNDLDGWVLSRLQTVIGLVEKHMASYELFRVVPVLVGFIDDLTNWYIRLSRRRFWRAADGADGDKQNAYRTLHHVMLTLSKALAPFLPFVSDEIYCNLSCGGGADSVHLEDYPEVQAELVDPELERRMGLARTAVALGRGLRSKHNVKIRQPLAAMTVVAQEASDRSALERAAEVIAEELNVKRLVVSADESELVSYSARPRLDVLGPKFGKRLGDIRKEVAALTSEDLARVVGGESLPSAAVDGLAYDTDTLLVDRASREGTVVDATDGVTVALDLTLTDELVREGYARELINRIQNQRKEMGLELDDRIEVDIRASGDVAQAVTEHWSLIASEVLADHACPDLDAPVSGGVSHEIAGATVEVSISVVPQADS
ncbi:MAG: isoleucine--tRNA ligase [bacterium]|nr:isoleucine--tRNA ligase [bacterium]